MAAGCNKPADDTAEEAVEVVRNHEDGTGLRGWHPRGRSDDPRVGAGVDAASDVDGGAKRHIVRYFGTGPCGRTQERRPLNRPGRRVKAPKWGEGERFASSGSFGSRASERQVEDPADDRQRDHRGGSREDQTTCYTGRTGVRRASQGERRATNRHHVNHMGASRLASLENPPQRKALGTSSSDSAA